MIRYIKVSLQLFDLTKGFMWKLIMNIISLSFSLFWTFTLDAVLATLFRVMITQD